MRWTIITPTAGPQTNPGCLAITFGLRYLIRQADPAAEFHAIPMYRDAPFIWNDLPNFADFLVFSGNPRFTWANAAKKQAFWDWEIYDRIDTAIGRGIRYIDAFAGSGFYYPGKPQGVMADEIAANPKTTRLMKTESKADLVIARDQLCSDVLAKYRIEHHLLPCCSYWAGDDIPGILPPESDDRTENLIVVAATPPHDWVARRIRQLHEQMARTHRTTIIVPKQEDLLWLTGRLGTWNEVRDVHSDPVDLLARYRAARNVLSFRLHATIPAAAAGAAVCHISLDERSQTLDLFGIKHSPFERLFQPLEFQEPPPPPSPAAAIAAFRTLVE